MGDARNVVRGRGRRAATAGRIQPRAPDDLHRDEDDAAPQLRSYRPDPDEAEELFRQVLRNVELFLYRNVIHGDLSAYNILVWEGQATLIDLPQAVHPGRTGTREDCSSGISSGCANTSSASGSAIGRSTHRRHVDGQQRN